MIVAELSANHNHSLEIARRSIEAIAATGADAVKLQTYTPDSLTLPVHSDDFLLKGGLWDGKYLYDLYSEAMTPYEWHEELYGLARSLGLVCFSTPFDVAGVDFLESLGTPIYKIASFEIAHHELIRRAASTGKPMVISTGIATPREIEEALEDCRREGNGDITLLKCTSAYPARPEDACLGDIPQMRARYGVKVGLSDHSPGSLLPVMATALGAEMIEKHFIIDRGIGGPDAAFSMDEGEFRKMVSDVRTAREAMRESNRSEEEALAISGRQWSRSLYVSAPIKKGERFTKENVACVRPGYSLHPRYLPELLGSVAPRDYQPGDRIGGEVIGKSE